MPKRKKASEDTVLVPLLPNFANAAVALLGKAAKGEQMNDDDKEGLETLRAAIQSAFVEYMRGGKP